VDLLSVLEHSEPPRSQYFIRLPTPYGKLRVDILSDNPEAAMSQGLVGEDAERANAMVNEAVRRAQRSEFVSAEELLLETVRRYPYCYDAYGVLCDVCLSLGRTHDAVYYGRQVVALVPSYHNLTRLGRALGQDDKLHEAATVQYHLWQVRHETDREGALEAIHGYLVTLAKLDDPGPMTDVCAQALREYPGDPTLLYQLAYAFLLQGRLAEAHAVAERALATLPLNEVLVPRFVQIRDSVATHLAEVAAAARPALAPGPSASGSPMTTTMPPVSSLSSATGGHRLNGAPVVGGVGGGVVGAASSVMASGLAAGVSATMPPGTISAVPPGRSPSATMPPGTIPPVTLPPGPLPPGTIPPAPPSRQHPNAMPPNAMPPNGMPVNGMPPNGLSAHAVAPGATMPPGTIPPVAPGPMNGPMNGTALNGHGERQAPAGYTLPRQQEPYERDYGPPEETYERDYGQPQAAPEPEFGLADIIAAVEGGNLPPNDGGLTVVPGDGDCAVLGFTGHIVVAADVDPDWVRDQLAPGDLCAPLDPPFLTALGSRTSRRCNNIDMTLLAPRLVGRLPLPLSEISNRRHPRVRRALEYRDDVHAWATEGGVLILGRGVGGRWEVAIEVDPDYRGEGLGRMLAAAGRHLVPGEMLWAQIAPGNAASVRAFLAAGFVPIGSEALLVT
jgi:GNAT superfamily N-acetyltransferase